MFLAGQMEMSMDRGIAGCLGPVQSFSSEQKTRVLAGLASGRRDSQSSIAVCQAYWLPDTWSRVWAMAWYSHMPSAQFSCGPLLTLGFPLDNLCMLKALAIATVIILIFFFQPFFYRDLDPNCWTQKSCGWQLCHRGWGYSKWPRQIRRLIKISQKQGSKFSRIFWKYLVSGVLASGGIRWERPITPWETGGHLRTGSSAMWSFFLWMPL